jgi:hypothetical protein
MKREEKKGKEKVPKNYFDSEHAVLHFFGKKIYENMGISQKR